MGTILIRKFLMLFFTVVISSTVYAEDFLDQYRELRSEEILRFSLSLFEEAEYYRCITEAKRYISNFPDEIYVEEMHKLIGDCYLMGQEWDKAILVYSKFVQRYPASSLINEVLFNKAICLVKKNLFEDAKNTFRQIVESRKDIKKEKSILWQILILIHQSRFDEIEKLLSDDAIKQRIQEKIEIIKKTVQVKKEIKYKSPVAAGIMSAALPGAGQVYNERYKDGFYSFILNGLFIVGAFQAFRNDIPAVGAILTIFETGWYTGNIYGAVNGAHKYNRKIKEDIFKKSLGNFDLQEYPVRETPSITIRFRF